MIPIAEETFPLAVVFNPEAKELSPVAPFVSLEELEKLKSTALDPIFPWFSVEEVDSLTPILSFSVTVDTIPEPIVVPHLISLALKK